MVEWIVLLEVARGGDDGPIDLPDLCQLLNAVGGRRPGALYSDKRYALQLSIDAPDAVEALRTAVSLWAEATRTLQLPQWSLVRTETLTPGEFERECQLYGGARDVEPPSLAAAVEAARRRGAEEAVLRNALHDPLTGLASQGLFLNNVDRALVRAHGATVHALLLIDVDDLGSVNEQLGRTRTDCVLASVAEGIAAGAGGTDGVGRLGSDQFAVLLEDTSHHDAAEVAQRILARVAGKDDGQHPKTGPTVSIGIALSEPEDDVDALLARAGAALRTAQSGGGDRVEIFSTEMSGADVTRLEAERQEMALPDAAVYLALLERAAVAISGCSTLEEAANSVLRHVCHTARLFGRLYLPRGRGERLSLATTCDPEGLEHRQPAPAGAERPVARHEATIPCARTGRAIWVSRIETGPEAATDQADPAARAELTGALAVPVVVDHKAAAILEFFGERMVEFDDLLPQVLTALGTHLARVAELEALKQTAGMREPSLPAAASRRALREDLGT